MDALFHGEVISYNNLLFMNIFSMKITRNVTHTLTTPFTFSLTKYPARECSTVPFAVSSLFT